MTRVALYARVSTQDKGQDTENQLFQLREYCQRQNWTIAAEYIDHFTGTKSGRDEFQAMFRDASRRKFELVLVWALDRFTREGVPETFIHIQRLREHGVEFVSYTEEHFRTTGPAGTLMIAIAAWIAQQERIRLVERTKAGLDRYRRDLEAGKAQSKSGKNLAPGGQRAVFRRDEAIRLRADGMSYPAIARELGTSTATVHRFLREAGRAS